MLSLNVALICKPFAETARLLILIQFFFSYLRVHADLPTYLITHDYSLFRVVDIHDDIVGGLYLLCFLLLMCCTL